MPAHVDAYIGTDFWPSPPFVQLIPEQVVSAYKRAILNIHPALLPAFGGKGFYGKRVHKAVIASGARYTGATVHFIDEKYDTGPILAQRVVRVYPTDTPETLAARVLEQVGLTPLPFSSVTGKGFTRQGDAENSD